MHERIVWAVAIIGLSVALSLLEVVALMGEHAGWVAGACVAAIVSISAARWRQKRRPLWSKHIPLKCPTNTGGADSE